MIRSAHGGTGWLEGIGTDLSASVNARPLPEEIIGAARDAALNMGRYPDPEYRRLREAIGELEDADPSSIVCGNGASELFTAAVNAYSPRAVGLFDPCYSGYETACRCVETRRHPLSEIGGFAVDGSAVDFAKSADIDMLFLPDPNNPTGRLIPPEIKAGIIEACLERGITVVLDECFYDLTAAGAVGSSGGRPEGCESVRPAEGVLRVKAFTKTFSVPGARIGYLIAGSAEEAERVRLALPEWNLSVFSEAVGIACAKIQRGTSWVADSLAANESEKAKLVRAFTEAGAKVYPSDANYILIRLPEGLSGLHARLAAKGILLRSCANFRGLGPEYVRVSVGCPADNEKLISALREETL